MSQDLGTLAGVETLVEVLCTKATRWFNDHGGHPLVSYLLATRSVGSAQFPPGDIGVLCLVAEKLDDLSDKEAFVATVREAVVASRAIGVVTVIEIWRIEAVSREEARALSQLESIETHPRRKEFVMVSFEHVRGSGVFFAPIARATPDGKPVLGAFQRGPLFEHEGRFADLLMKERFA